MPRVAICFSRASSPCARDSRPFVGLQPQSVDPAGGDARATRASATRKRPIGCCAGGRRGRRSSARERRSAVRPEHPAEPAPAGDNAAARPKRRAANGGAADTVRDSAAARSAANLRRKSVALVRGSRRRRVGHRVDLLERCERRCERCRHHIGRSKGRCRPVRNVVPVAGDHPAFRKGHVYDRRRGTELRRRGDFARRRDHATLDACGSS
jgi:hypothetical protein